MPYAVCAVINTVLCGFQPVHFLVQTCPPPLFFSHPHFHTCFLLPHAQACWVG